ncbi:Os05g0501350 [Oryza sativa Japonica Group]|uniref:Os05g0501350 protein n=1 Tax=Oryza sativa subsp. japonica TaxID=39947 RepID=C7J2H5_ORYSJ|nr:Os05g0501350 [Oryza sativa Japonica Group]|eukprot:NP_001174479.1 Os05g0501350 [Oryza sativa Japonica Group]
MWSTGKEQHDIIIANLSRFVLPPVSLSETSYSSCNSKIQLPEGINRPITRSFGAQLLKKAQENAVGANKIPVRKEPAPKPAKKVVPRLENAAKASTGAGVNENKKPSESEGAGSSGSGGGSAHKYSRKKVVNTLNNCAYCSFQGSSSPDQKVTFQNIMLLSEVAQSLRCKKARERGDAQLYL